MPTPPIADPAISIVLPVRDGGEDLRRCLDWIADQDVDGVVETVVIDSGSSDGSRELAEASGASVVRIPASEFDHGATRNLGVRHARAPLIVFTSQDAHAEDRDWLRRLTAPLEDPAVVAVYGRQLPHPGANPAEEYFLDFLYGPTPRRQRAACAHELSMATTLFSNVNAAMRRTALLDAPFVEDIIMSEDQEWISRKLLEGHDVLYEPSAAVRHSHAYTHRQAFRRFFDSGVSAERSYLAGAAGADTALRQSAVRYAFGEVRWLVRTGRLRALPSVVALEVAKFAGLQFGKRHRRLPTVVKRRMSALPNHWNRAGAPERPLVEPAPAPAPEKEPA